MLLFLHADTFLDDSARPAIFEALSNRSIIGGNFRVAFVPPSRFGRMVELIYLMLRPLSIYYGDSGIFVRRHVYEEIGGVPPWPLFEDWELVRRLERAGPTCQVRGVVAQTSSRRFEGRALRSLAVWTVLQLLFWAGVPPLQLARRYPDLR